MTGDANPPPDHQPAPRWLDLVDLATGEIVGQLSPSGETITADPKVAERLQAAFGRALMVRDGEVVAELGICYADVETLPPGSADHRALVLRNLAALTGYLPVACPTTRGRRPSAGT